MVDDWSQCAKDLKKTRKHLYKEGGSSKDRCSDYRWKCEELKAETPGDIFKPNKKNNIRQHHNNKTDKVNNLYIKWNSRKPNGN